MSWATLDPAIRTIAETTLTAKQLVAYKLHSNGMSERDIAIHLRISRRAVRDRLTEADIKILAHPHYPKEATMTIVQEIRIASLEGLAVPEGLVEGSRIRIEAELLVSVVDQEWIDVTTEVGKPEMLPGGVTLGCVATKWSAT